jgi:DNA-binding MarR family transcriptional regulator
VNRLVERGAAVRRQSQEDRREVLVDLTPVGEEILEKLKELHMQELQTKSPELCKALQAIVDSPYPEMGKAGAGVAVASH